MKTEYPRPHFEREGFIELKTQSEQTFTLPEGFVKDTLLLNVHGSGKVILNGTVLNAQEGIDITSHITEGENHLQTEGAIKNLWLESVPRIYIKNVFITPFFDDKKVRFEFGLSENAEVTVEIFACGRLLAASNTRCASCEIALSEIYPWTPSEPFLYEVMLTAGKDVVKTYFGMRKFSLIRSNDITHIALNREPYFPVGTTCTDIASAKAAGFDMIRVTERMPDKWYADCDRAGIIVWQACCAEGLYSFASVGVLTVEGTQSADTTRLLDCPEGDIIIVHKRCGKSMDKAKVFEYSKKRISSFFRKSSRMIKKGAAAAVFTSEAIPAKTDVSGLRFLTRSCTH